MNLLYFLKKPPQALGSLGEGECKKASTKFIKKRTSFCRLNVKDSKNDEILQERSKKLVAAKENMLEACQVKTNETVSLIYMTYFVPFTIYFYVCVFSFSQNIS